MEEKFKQLLEGNFTNLNYEDEVTIFQWTGKILYGTLYRELSLQLDRTKPNLGKLLTPDYLESFSSLHLFLQSIRVTTIFQSIKPWSIFIFNYEDDDFDYINDIEHLSFSIKLGKVGITITFEDNNVIEKDMSRLKKLYNFELYNTLQFLEVSTLIFYYKRLATNVPFYISSYRTNEEINIKNPLIINTTRSISFRKWDDDEYSSTLQYTCERRGIIIDTPMTSKEGMRTSLFDKDGIPFLQKINK